MLFWCGQARNVRLKLRNLNRIPGLGHLKGFGGKVPIEPGIGHLDSDCLDAVKAFRNRQADRLVIQTK
jgi:hypothetical protein